MSKKSAMGKTERVRDTAPRHSSYILRLWETRTESAGEPPAWRFSLEDLQKGKRYGFANMEMLVAFLDDKTRSLPSSEE